MSTVEQGRPVVDAKPIPFERGDVDVEMHDITIEEAISKGLELRERKDKVQWELGDLADLVTKEFGPNYLDEFSKGIGIEVKTIKRYRDIARAFDFDLREEFKIVSWSHFRELATSEKPKYWLQRIADEGWSIEKLRQMMKSETGTKEEKESVVDDGLPVPPMPKLIFCTGCRKWGFEDMDYLGCPSGGQCMEVK